MTLTTESSWASTDSVYRPQDDSYLLIDALRTRSVIGRDVADLCTGSGVIAVHAAQLGARKVTAVDSSAAAVRSVCDLIRRHGLQGRIDVVHDDVATFGRCESFDLITCNPPYVPTPGTADAALHPPGPNHCWDAGPCGRDVLDIVCLTTPALLRPGGSVLIVQSEFADIPATLDALSGAGLRSRVVAEAEIPFGPVLSARAAWLEETGLLDVGRRREVIAVVCAERER
ncbi:methyltransferase [Gordonia sp. TBRC 11910]|uniref:Methyltransferase n=1 Tax=Gordonia asplenii TaxID=2725283 RepID=A0A848KU60_9ACTN|nr:HemK2/MTQ2 family protein methyltransferase [Gordonia asplenii]NMO01812.1 methyltransferase [Gordonia asplenii]